MMTRIAIVLIVASLYLSYTAGSDVALDCCLLTSDQVLPRRLAKAYTLSDAGCSIKATIFTTRKGKHVCAPPPEKSKWVRNLISYLDSKKSRGSQ
ncbi:C-C motif chemokine 26-like [Clupea harengus]|uniref:C-C motif chemokine 26-like n=1 Tax=Clupea harengus TaxID=7950 RepID=A0A6P8FIR3_CLUHA|nr:C-C motif chemokine 26-like [Clupea harengus]